MKDIIKNLDDAQPLLLRAMGGFVDCEQKGEVDPPIAHTLREMLWTANRTVMLVRGHVARLLHQLGHDQPGGE